MKSSYLNDWYYGYVLIRFRKVVLCLRHIQTSFSLNVRLNHWKRRIVP